MSTTPTTPTDPNAPEPSIGTQPKAPTPLEHPEIYYNLKWRVAPLVVTTEEQKDALDPTEWTEDPAHISTPGKGADKPHYPKLFYNVNVPPVIVGSADDARALGETYKEFTISEDLAKSAEATAQEAAAKQQPA